MRKRKVKRSWGVISVPQPLAERVKTLSKREGTAMWKILQRTVDYWIASYKGHFKDAPDLDKASWYAYKLSASIGELRAKPSAESLKMLRKTIAQVRDRLSVETSMLEKAASQYVKKPTRQNRVALNDAAKFTVLQIIASTLGIELL